MPVVFTHDPAPRLHTFRFPASDGGPPNRLILDLDEPEGSPDRLVCTCRAAAYQRLCWHKRWILGSLPGWRRPPPRPPSGKHAGPQDEPPR